MTTSFQKLHRIAVKETAEALELGGFRVSMTGELAHARLVVYRHGVAAGGEQMRLCVYAKSDLNDPLYQSDWRVFPEGGTRKLGRCRFRSRTVPARSFPLPRLAFHAFGLHINRISSRVNGQS